MKNPSSAEITIGLVIGLTMLFVAPLVAIQLWEWHVVPVWPGTPTPSYAHTFGLGVLWTLYNPAPEPPEGKTILEVTLASVGRLGFALLFGWIAT